MGLWDRVVTGKDFYQSCVNHGEDWGNVCFRLSFKWLACQMIDSAGPFKFGWWNSTTPDEVLRAKLPDSFPAIKQAQALGRPSHNMASTFAKQGKYLDKFKLVEGEGKPYEPFKATILQATAATLEEWRWGSPGKKRAAPKYNLHFGAREGVTRLTGRNFLTSMILCVLGRSPGGPWAHAVSFFKGRERVTFFDANKGECLFPTRVAAEVIAQEVDEALRALYATDGYTVDEYVLFPARVG